MKKLLRVVHHQASTDVALPGQLPRGAQPHRWPKVIMTNEIHEYDSFIHDGEFFEIEEEDVELFLQVFAQANPGKEVHIYSLTKVGQCPAGPMIVKQVSADGVLPG